MGWGGAGMDGSDWSRSFSGRVTVEMKCVVERHERRTMKRRSGCWEGMNGEWAGSLVRGDGKEGRRKGMREEEEDD